MNYYDFTHVGGFPINQDQLKFLQDALIESTRWLGCGADGVTTPIILSGVVDDNAGGYTDGWVLFDDSSTYEDGSPTGFQIYRFVGGLGSRYEIQETRTDLAFFGNVPKDVQISKVMVCTDVSGIPVSSLIRLSDNIGVQSKTAWLQETVGAPWAGDIFYKRNLLTRQLYIKGTLTHSSAQSIAIPNLRMALFTLPVGFRPGDYYQFFGTVLQNSVNPEYYKDSNDKDYLRGFIMGINSAGLLSMTPIRPEASITSITISFNAIIPLD